MQEIILSVIGLGLALYGIADLILRLCYRLLFTTRGEGHLLVLPVDGEQAEYAVRRLAMLLKWYPLRGFRPVVWLTEENAALAKLCEELALEYRVRPQNTLQATSTAL